MAPIMLGPALALGALGVSLALVQREDRDVPFLAWLVVLGGGIVFGIGHNEARYLLPVVPAVIYFSVRAVEAVVARLSRLDVLGKWRLPVLYVGGSFLLITAVTPGVRQAWLDRDPVFLNDVERRIGLRLLEDHGGRLMWWGGMHTFAARRPVVMRQDEVFNIFHLTPSVVEYFVDRRLTVPAGLERVTAAELPFSPLVQDGDTIVRASGAYRTAAVPAEGLPPVELWTVRRVTFVRDGDRFVSAADPTSTLELGTLAPDELTIRARRDLGRWSVLASPPGGGTPRRLSDVILEPGRAASLGPGSAAIDRLVLTDVKREVIN